ncbi:MAG: WxcM-like domain-containing protein [Deltaproteobacteria bacterium]|nr:WxcM-like domain-containing protein [Deltaproteobacteria bacterium]
MSTTVDDCILIDLPRIGERRGYITPIYGGEHIPFAIQRVYYLYDIPGGANRAGHAHKELQQLIVSAVGSFDVLLDDGREKRRINLSRPYYGIYVPRLIWRELENFSSGGICLVLASLPYEEADYIRSYQDFMIVKAAA